MLSRYAWNWGRFWNFTICCGGLLHAVTVTLHPEVVVKLQLNVARSIEESELQASGKSIQELAAEAEAAAEFEIAELFDEMGAAAGDDE